MCCFVLMSNLVSHLRGRTWLIAYENRVPRKIVGSMREVTGGWR